MKETGARRQRPFGQSRRFGTAAASRRARGSGYHAHARNRLWTGSGTIRGTTTGPTALRRLWGSSVSAEPDAEQWS
jgi:hypothetical protein